MGELLERARDLLDRLIALPQNLMSRRRARFRLGDIYLDCNWEPCVVTRVELDRTSRLGPWDWDISGISLLDGSYGHGCNSFHCAPEKLEYKVAEHIVSLMLGRRLGLDEALDQRAAGVRNIQEIYRSFPELRRLWQNAR